MVAVTALSPALKYQDEVPRPAHRGLSKSELTYSDQLYKYNQENALGGASFFAVDGTWTEASSTFSNKTASLAILGGDADVDNFIQRTRSNIQDQRAIQTQLKAKSVARKFEDTFITGDTGVDANSFDGIRKQTAAGQTISVATNGGPLTLALLDQVMDLILGTKPTLLLMSRRTRRKLKSLLQASAHYVERGDNGFGRQVMLYDGVPVEISDYQPDSETQGTDNATSSLYAIYFNEGDGLVGLQNGGIEVLDVGQLQTKDANRVRIRWYVSIAILRDSALARVKGISNA